MNFFFVLRAGLRGNEDIKRQSRGALGSERDNTILLLEKC
jgi:hypothetical protein